MSIRPILAALIPAVTLLLWAYFFVNPPQINQYVSTDLTRFFFTIFLVPLALGTIYIAARVGRKPIPKSKIVKR